MLAIYTLYSITKAIGVEWLKAIKMSDLGFIFYPKKIAVVLEIKL